MRLVFAITLAGCGFTIDTGAGIAIGPDGAVDSSAIEIDAQPDANAPDAPCTAQMIELLQNPAFDTSPIGWTQSATIITSGGTMPEDTQPNKAWLGGVTSTSDSLFQDFVIPASAFSLRLTGKYQVRTTDSTTSVRDTARIMLDGAPGALFEVDNTLATTTWESFVVPILAVDPDTTRRLTLSSINDGSLSTSFYFDSLSLIAGACQ